MNCFYNNSFVEPNQNPTFSNLCLNTSELLLEENVTKMLQSLCNIPVEERKVITKSIKNPSLTDFLEMIRRCELFLQYRSS